MADMIPVLHRAYQTFTGINLPLDQDARDSWKRWLGYSRQHYGREWASVDLIDTLRHIKASKYFMYPGSYSFRYLIRDPSNFAVRYSEMKALQRMVKSDPARDSVLRTARMFPPVDDNDPKVVTGRQAAIKALEKLKRDLGFRDKTVEETESQD